MAGLPAIARGLRDDEGTAATLGRSLVGSYRRTAAALSWRACRPRIESREPRRTTGRPAPGEAFAFRRRIESDRIGVFTGS